MVREALIIIRSKDIRMNAAEPLPRAAAPVSGAPRAILRLEGALVLVAAVAAYAQHSGHWGLFLLLFLVPDLSMLGYLAGARMGAVTYNIVHSYVLPLSIGLAGIGSAQPALIDVALIWIAHIGLDRMLGYGLKYGSAFGHTHLGLLGRARPVSGDRTESPARG